MSCYAASSYTILIDSSGNLKVKDRSTARIVSTFSLGATNVKVTKSGASFCPIGASDPVDAAFTTNLSGNTVNIDTSCVLQIASGKSIDLALYNVEISLASGVLSFTESAV